MAYDLGLTAQSRFGDLESSSAAPEAIRYLRRLVSEGSDFDCYKINAYRVAAAAGVPVLEAVRAMLFATRLGVCDLNWDIHCPSCLGLPEFHKHLMNLRSAAHCPLCDLRWDISFEDQVEVTFTINPDIRPLPVESFAEKAFPADARVYTERLARDGRLPDIASPLQPGQDVVLEGNLQPGEYLCATPGHPGGAALLRVDGPACEQVQEIRLAVDGSGLVSPPELTARPGPARFSVANGYPAIWGIAVRPVGTPRNWLNAAYVTGLQDFRDLFSGEFLAPGLSFAIRSVTLLFTDIKGSTEMYERLGDAAAFALVQQHFELMTDAIRRYEGGLVKTIGDAVMASFRVNRDAVAAALEIQRGFASVNAPLDEIEVKIGLHRGPAIAVTSNRMLDFFGRTVNIAARVQGQSRAGEVLLSDAVVSDPAVRELLNEWGLRPGKVEAELKGIAGKAELTSVMVGKSAPKVALVAD